MERVLPGPKRYFNPRPPRGGRHTWLVSKLKGETISIHALREEGDEGLLGPTEVNGVFQSTPSARRATVCQRQRRLDGEYFNPRPPRGGRRGHADDSQRVDAISIHALREEGDASNMQQMANQVDFNPRPPRGGRHKVLTVTTLKLYFNPRPPRGGRRQTISQCATSIEFQSTPSARRATHNLR